MTSPADQIVQLARAKGVIRPRDVQGVNDASPYLARLVERGVMIKVGRGLYTLADREPGASFSLVQATVRVPGSVVCLISALEFHGFTTQTGYRVWLAVDHKRALKVDDIPVRIIRMSGAPYSHGVQKHEIDGNVVSVYSPAKTTADCFRYRSKVGLDVALEALREGWRERKFTIDELMECARVNRVETVMRPYVEAVVS
jgi:predicted transcriptional regulator of viral defense system